MCMCECVCIDGTCVLLSSTVILYNALFVAELALCVGPSPIMSFQ